MNKTRPIIGTAATSIQEIYDNARQYRRSLKLMSDLTALRDTLNQSITTLTSQLRNVEEMIAAQNADSGAVPADQMNKKPETRAAQSQQGTGADVAQSGTTGLDMPSSTDQTRLTIDGGDNQTSDATNAQTAAQTSTPDKSTKPADKK